MVLALSQGATLTCTSGTAPSVFNATPQPLVATGLGLQAATITQAAPGVNILPFGTCNVLTAAASGVPTPCVPATMVWAPPAVLTMVAGVPVATVQSKCPCMIGGVVSVAAPGQALIDVT